MLSGLEVVAICGTVVVSVLGVAAIFAGAWVKASDLLKLQNQLEKQQGEIDKLWERFTVVAILETKIKAIEDGIRDIKELLQK